jgi:hypothetical protein
MERKAAHTTKKILRLFIAKRHPRTHTTLDLSQKAGAQQTNKHTYMYVQYYISMHFNLVLYFLKKLICCMFFCKCMYIEIECEGDLHTSKHTSREQILLLIIAKSPGEKRSTHVRIIFYILMHVNLVLYVL